MSPGNRGRNQKAVEIVSRSPEETQGIGAELGRSLPIPAVILLRGALGAGKTTFARGVAQGLGVEDHSRVSSPSFTLVNVYHGICPIYHVDLYRLQSGRDLYSIGLEDFIGTEGVTIIEWSEKLRSYSGAAVEVRLRDAGDDLRILQITLLGRHLTRGKKTAAGRRARH